MGYANNAKGYRLFDEEKKRILIVGMSSLINQTLIGKQVEASCSDNEVIMNTDERETSADKVPVDEAAIEGSRIRELPRK